jgi:hypothetical protein
MVIEDEAQGDFVLLSRIALLERRLQSLAALVLETRTPRGPGEPRSDRVEIEADDQGELASGFHHREHDAAGNPFRWAGKSAHFELRFHIDRCSARPFHMLGKFVSGLRTDQLRAYVDYRPIPLRTEHRGPMTWVSGLLPADPLGGATTLTFHCPPVPAPGQLDQRLLSFAFVRLVAGDMAGAIREAA